MHIYYESEEVEKKEVDIVVLAKIKTKEDAKREAEKKVQDLEKRREALKGEEKVITKNSVKFAIFLKSNAIAAYNDSFESYLEYLIENHKILVKEGSKNKNIIKGLEEMLAAYKKEKNIHEQMMKYEAVSFDMAADEIFKLKDELYSLPMYGKKIA
jgi:iron-sulfur cluster repair protein YtfE (RIC family)